MVSLEETIAVYRVIPGAGLSVLPETPHPIEQMNMPLLAGEVRSFLSSDTVDCQ
jgi:esterase